LLKIKANNLSSHPLHPLRPLLQLFKWDTWVCLLCSIAVLFLGIGLHLTHHYPFDWHYFLKITPLFILFIFIYGVGRWGENPGACCLARTLSLCLFASLSTTVALHVLPLSPFPLIDHTLSKTDQTLGFNTGLFADAIKQYHPVLNYYSYQAYQSLIWLIYFSIFILPWASTRDHPKDREIALLFSISFFLGAFICFFLPAIGPMASYSYWLDSTQNTLLKNIDLLRYKGASSHLFLGSDISFPSFHTILAIFCAWVWRDFKLIFWPVFILSLAIIFSTLSTGWHYLSDVLSGVLVSFICIYLTHWILNKNNNK